jgi:trans-AT polyketide synthase/acyltransferase/oxidoreductase domain-containing protein
MTVAVVFAGQGGQHRGMGEELFGLFAGLVDSAEHILGYSLWQLCAEDPDSRLHDTEYAQPAIYVVNALAYRKFLLDGGPRADVLLGHSLGEYNALEAAGVFDFETGLRIVRERARLMTGVAGSMTAVMGLSAETVDAILAARPELGTEISAVNAPQQVVVAGPDTRAAIQVLREAGALGATALKVSGPFHTSHMTAAATAFEAFLGRHRSLMGRPGTPVIANRTARPHEPGGLVRDLAGQINHTLQWQKSVETVLDQDRGAVFRQVNGSALTSFSRQIQRHRRRAASASGSRR